MAEVVEKFPLTYTLGVLPREESCKPFRPAFRGVIPLSDVSDRAPAHPKCLVEPLTFSDPMSHVFQLYGWVAYLLWYEARQVLYTVQRGDGKHFYTVDYSQWANVVPPVPQLVDVDGLAKVVFPHLVVPESWVFTEETLAAVLRRKLADPEDPGSPWMPLQWAPWISEDGKIQCSMTIEYASLKDSGQYSYDDAVEERRRVTGYAWVDPDTIPLPEALSALDETLTHMELARPEDRTTAICLLIHAAFYSRGEIRQAPIYVLGNTPALSSLAANIQRRHIDWRGISEDGLGGMGIYFGSDEDSKVGVPGGPKVYSKWQTAPHDILIVECPVWTLSSFYGEGTAVCCAVVEGPHSRSLPHPAGCREDTLGNIIWGTWANAYQRLAQDTTGRSLAVLLRALRYIDTLTIEQVKASATRMTPDELEWLTTRPVEVPDMPEWSALARRVSLWTRAGIHTLPVSEKLPE